MKVLTADDIRRWDQFTILNEPVAPIELMERAATMCANWLLDNYPVAPSFSIFCGKGNNGGDGLVIARKLIEKNYRVSVHILEFGHKGTEDFQTNLARLHKLSSPGIHFIQSSQQFHTIPEGQVIVDALFGSGLNRKLDGVVAQLVNHINSSGNEIVSVDVPTGLFVDNSSKGNTVIKATHTLSFGCYKPAFLFAENEKWIGNIHILDIGLHPDFYPTVSTVFEITDDVMIRSIYKPRKRFSHKGNFGHALLVAGSYGKLGAAVLAARACLRSGTGLLTCHIPRCGYDIVQSSVPEAMVSADINSSYNTTTEIELSKYNVIGIGPGLGTAPETRKLLREILDTFRNPVVLDADALNTISMEKDLLQLIPDGSILTPHPREFDRVFGESPDDFKRAQLALAKAKELNCIIVLKGHHTLVATPDEKGFFNSTGNAGMATAGSGDVLTGILTGLLAQDYDPVETAILGVYLHGMAGDIAAKSQSEEAMIAGDIVENLGSAFQLIQQ